MSTPEAKQTAIDNAVSWSADVYRDKNGHNADRFTSLPDINTPFNYDGGTFVRVSDPVTVTRFGRNSEKFTAIDLRTGKTITIDSKKGRA